ncbi:response regulator [bacterium]|nr:response regulator [bacterium]MBU3955828.1 response regulator [bacterium]
MRIILADEDIDRRFAVKLLWRNYDCVFREARNFDILTLLIKEETPDICIINYLLSGSKGFNIYDMCRKLTGEFNVPVLVLLPDNISAEHEIPLVRFLSSPGGMPVSHDVISEKVAELTGKYPALKKSGGDFERKKLKKILIADDESSIRKLLLVLLKAYEVEEAASGVELEDKAVSFKPDLIISDVIMPGISGWKAVRNIRAKDGFEEIPVIFASGYVKDKEIYEMHRPDGPTEFLLKPFTKQGLFTAVEKFFVLEK